MIWGGFPIFLGKHPYGPYVFFPEEIFSIPKACQVHRFILQPTKNTQASTSKWIISILRLTLSSHIIRWIHWMVLKWEERTFGIQNFWMVLNPLNPLEKYNTKKGFSGEWDVCKNSFLYNRVISIQFPTSFWNSYTQYLVRKTKGLEAELWSLCFISSFFSDSGDTLPETAGVRPGVSGGLTIPGGFLFSTSGNPWGIKMLRNKKTHKPWFFPCKQLSFSCPFF